jgi:hypothetical protein
MLRRFHTRRLPLPHFIQLPLSPGRSRHDASEFQPFYVVSCSMLPISAQGQILSTPTFSQHSGDIGMPFPLCDAKWGPAISLQKSPTHIATGHACGHHLQQKNVKSIPKVQSYRTSAGVNKPPSTQDICAHMCSDKRNTHADKEKHSKPPKVHPHSPNTDVRNTTHASFNPDQTNTNHNNRHVPRLGSLQRLPQPGPSPPPRDHCDWRRTLGCNHQSAKTTGTRAQRG